MASKRRLRKNGCGTKARYATKQDASDHWYSYFKSFGDALNVYKCPFCKRWHLGHHRKQRL